MYVGNIYRPHKHITLAELVMQWIKRKTNYIYIIIVIKFKYDLFGNENKIILMITHFNEKLNLKKKHEKPFYVRLMLLIKATLLSYPNEEQYQSEVF